MNIIDIDDQETWPTELLELVDHWTSNCRDAGGYTLDLPIPLEFDKKLQTILNGRLLRAYHCTRLLPHEKSMIESLGLRALSVELVKDRIRSAEDNGDISSSVATELLESNVFNLGEGKYREKQVCLILSKRLFRNSPDLCERLLSTWGGEAIYKLLENPDLQSKLKILGAPTVVVARIELSNTCSEHSIYPMLLKTFVGSNLDLTDAHADVFYRLPIPRENIEQILQPGDRSYDSLGSLPR